MTLPLLWLGVLSALIAAGYWYESSPWRHCRRCGYFWNLKTGKEYNYLPDDADGIVKNRECKTCERMK